MANKTEISEKEEIAWTIYCAERVAFNAVDPETNYAQFLGVIQGYLIAHALSPISGDNQKIWLKALQKKFPGYNDEFIATQLIGG